ncbi:hypothetical protein GCM10008090_10170 [Arenicella chitinivorans]|uniref:VCBS repeat-containing protein n=1 Tax=Arenicella chitinivorans TaxID=1329800 RepID=A0A918RLP4_9GAMM|nr:VCBS repeat-containing protein [Arenicella chitinivorans]GHA03164.1 hypothetical protein GCM10008090_10170 [Arenicella chitinivorans]
MKFRSKFMAMAVGFVALNTLNTSSAELRPNQKTTFPGIANLSGLPSDSRVEQTHDDFFFPEKFFADVDADGYKDYIGIDGAKVHIMRGTSNTAADGRRRWTDNFPAFEDGSLYEHEVRDITNDNRADLISFSKTEGTVIVTQGDWTQRRKGFKKIRFAIFNQNKQAISRNIPLLDSKHKTLVDFNNNGYIDYISTYASTAVVIQGTNTGYLDASKGEYSTGSHFDFSFQRFIDINNDGLLDFVGVEDGTAVVALANSNGRFNNAPPILSGDHLQSDFKEFADVNGDTYQDLVTIKYEPVADSGETTIYVTLGTAEGFPSNSVVKAIPVGAFPYDAVQIADINNDSHADFIGLVTSGSVSRADFIPGTSDGVFDFSSKVEIVDPTFAATSTRIMDFNRDGYLDFFGLEGRTATLIPGIRAGGFDLAEKQASISSHFDDSVDKRIEDLNNDGFPDLILLGEKRALKNGEVFPCSCKRKSYPGTHFVKRNSYMGTTHFISTADGKRPSDQIPIMAQFDTGNIFKGQKCYCAVVDNFNDPWYPSIGRKNKYASSCIGLCGEQCGKNARGLTDSRRRYFALVVHDVCQAFIGSTAPIHNKGLANACGDEGIRGTDASIHSKINEPHGCKGGGVPEVHQDFIPPN